MSKITKFMDLSNYGNALPFSANGRYCQPILELAKRCSLTKFSYSVRPYLDGAALFCPSFEQSELKVVCNRFSCGSDDGELEVFGAIASCDDDLYADGCLTIDDVFERIEYFYQRKRN